MGVQVPLRAPISIGVKHCLHFLQRNRSEASREYIFSVVTVCAECSRSFNIIGGNGPMARYGCIDHPYRGTCTNKLILRKVVGGSSCGLLLIPYPRSVKCIYNPSPTV
jgi:hypothetical protein